MCDTSERGLTYEVRDPQIISLLELVGETTYFKFTILLFITRKANSTIWVVGVDFMRVHIDKTCIYNQISERASSM